MIRHQGFVVVLRGIERRIERGAANVDIPPVTVE
jgi:hypothetical protein